MPQPLSSEEGQVRESGAICDDLEATADYAIGLVCDALIMARQLQRAIDFRWRLMSQTKQMTNGMNELSRRATKKLCGPQP